MPEVLTQSQIDDLLKGITSGQVDVKEMEEQQKESKKAKPYDFRSPKRFTKEQLKTLNSIYENYSRLLGSYFTSLLRVFCQVEVLSIEEQRYHEFNNALPDSVLLASGEISTIENEENEGMFLMEISRNLSFVIIDRLLGGNGDPMEQEREYTEIELSILGGIFSKIIPMIADGWTNYYEIKADFDRIETNARLVQGIAPDEIVVLIVLDMTVRNLTSTITVCVPAVFLEAIMKKLSSRNWSKIRKADSVLDENRKEILLSYIKESPLELRGVLGHVDVTTKDIVELKVGDVLKLPKLVGEMIDLNVGDTTWFKGNIGIKRMNKAIQIEQVL